MQKESKIGILNKELEKTKDSLADKLHISVFHPTPLFLEPEKHGCLKSAAEDGVTDKWSM